MRPLRAIVHNPDWEYAGGGEKVTAVIAERLRSAGWNVELAGSRPVDIPRLERVLNVSLDGCRFRETGRSPSAAFAGLSHLSPRAARFLHGRSAFRFAREADLLVHITGSIPAFCPARAGLLFVQFPYDPQECVRLTEGGVPLRWADREKLARLASWDIRVCPSSFVRDWVKKRWATGCEVLHPPAETGACRPLAKDRLILTAGRFYATGPTKKHAVMVRAFRELCDSGLEGWKLAVAGGTHPRPDHRQYLQEIRALAEGYPVEVLTDLAFQDIVPLYGRAAIYWHATGAGEDESSRPELFEQFGMTIVEAMASGAVPVVIGGGGIRDIVRPGTDGFLWQTPEELKSRTMELIRDPALRDSLARSAVARAAEFSREAFERRVDAIIAELASRLR